MRIAVIGGGPGGLHFAALAKQLAPEREITLWERNAPDDTFGFGVVFSDETLDGIEQADPEVFRAVSAEFARWRDIDVHYRGRRLTSGGHGFAALERRRLLAILRERCAGLGVDLRFGTEAPPAEQLTAEYDLVVAADGVHSATRQRHAEQFRPELDERGCRYIWLATDRVFEAFTFIVEQTDFGVLQVHAYPYNDRRSTFIVELGEAAWRRSGLAEDPDGVGRLERLLADHLAGHRLIAGNSRWITFSTVRNARWHHGNLVLLGDAAHTAHFSIGSGTKLAMEDALALAACLHEQPDVPGALAAYEAERRPVVESTQRAAQASLEWFESIAGYVGQGAEQFAFNLLTRSRRVTYDNLRERDPEFVAEVDAWFDRGADRGDDRPATPPMFHPYRLGALTLHNRIVVPPLASYTAVDGVPGEFDAAQFTAHALGGAGLVLAGMTAVSPQGRATPDCPGLYTDGQEQAWRRIVTAARLIPGTRLGIQLTHAGRRAATGTPGPDGIGPALPTERGGWPTLAASPLPWDPGGPPPREASRAELAEITREFAAAAARADRAGFDVLELQLGHGHLLSGFLSPLTNRRTDEFGGTLAARLRYPLRVVAAVRAVWPADKPLLARISATDWAAGGTTAQDAVRIARALAGAGVDAIDVSTGEVVAEQRPRYGRSYQTPFADLIRNATGLPVIAVGAISGHDDANSILLAGRADLVAVGRAHLHDPLWTLHAAADQGYTGPGAPWPPAWLPGSRKPPGPRADRVSPRLVLLRTPAEPVHRRWLPKPDPDRSR
ncbi:FAD-dependent monooxygenase [Kitasatospora sp. LaBMicrA B282]|uniref:oxidoreductase n=1 Tax=Kitasatospora sp. LaBMicrA B282 TaxID=3420949 RepID=UPI003D10BBC7